MTETTATPVHNAKAILQEALDTIQATYWIQRAEAKFAALDLWDETDKAIVATLEEHAWSNPHFYTDAEHDDKVKVIGVCSVGALALANVTLYDEPLASFDLIVNRDVETWKAAQALAQAIVESYPGVDMTDAGGVIANWNDEDGRTREEVIEAFEQALTSPLLAATELYQIASDHPEWGQELANYFFASPEQAQQFITTLSAMRDRVMGVLDITDPAHLEVRKFTHDSLIGV